MTQGIIIYLVMAGMMTFAMFGADKYKAVKNKRRIPESSLIMACFLGGAFGGMAGMYLFRHKTRHLKFRLLVPFSVLLWVGALVLLYGDFF